MTRSRGQTFSHDDGDHEDAPAEDVDQVVVGRSDNGHNVGARGRVVLRLEEVVAYRPVNH